MLSNAERLFLEEERGLTADIKHRQGPGLLLSGSLVQQKDCARVCVNFRSFPKIQALLKTSCVFFPEDLNLDASGDRGLTYRFGPTGLTTPTDSGDTANGAGRLSRVWE